MRCHLAARTLALVPIMLVSAVAVRTASAQPPGPGGKRLSTSVFAGVSFGGTTDVTIQPPPGGPPFTAPNGRPSSVVPTWTFKPGSDLIEGMLEVLGESAGVTPLDDVLNGRPLYEPAWNVGVRLSWSRDPSGGRRHSWYAEGSYNGTGFSDPAPEMKQTIDDLAAVFRDDLFSTAPDKAASGTVVTRGGYKGAFVFTGGLECAFPDWRLAARAGPAVVVPLGGAPVTEVRFDYRFIGGGIPFQESDRVDLTFTSSGGFGLAAGVGYRQPLRRGLDLELDLTLLGYHRTQEILMSTSPASVPGATLGAAAFSTPPGSPTMVFSTNPNVPTSLSGTVTDHTAYSTSGFVWQHLFRVGVRF